MHYCGYVIGIPPFARNYSEPCMVFSLYFAVDGFIHHFLGLQSASMTFPLYYGIQQPPPSLHRCCLIIGASLSEPHMYEFYCYICIYVYALRSYVHLGPGVRHFNLERWHSWPRSLATAKPRTWALQVSFLHSNYFGQEGSFTSIQLLGSLRMTLRPCTRRRAAYVAAVDETAFPEVAW